MTASQQNLFDLDPPAWEVADATERLVARVVVLDGPTQPLDYIVPETLRDQVEIGRRVRIPLGRGNRMATGYCVSLESRAVEQGKLKEIAALVDRTSLFSPEMVRLTEWMADHYLCPWAAALETVVPAGVRFGAGTREATLLSAAPDARERIGEEKLSGKQAQVLEYALSTGKPLTARQIQLACKCSTAPIAALRKKRLLRATRERQSRETTVEAPATREASLTLNPEQDQALAMIRTALNAGRHETVLIHGVTGSGKTEVYIQAIQEVIRFGRQAIVLVPEISLTPQTKQRFRARFANVALLHSHLSDAQRSAHWQKIAAGEIDVVVGARSAIFAPTPHLGIIILDEEHEGSFKQDAAPRYHARDVARYRAQAQQIPLVLGSATPSLESWRLAREGAARFAQMPRRVSDRPMPHVATIDLREGGPRRRVRGAISRQLHVAMDQALRDGGQVILLLNRRGFATHIQCPSCGAVVKCPNCEIALTHHRDQERALCHYCDYEIPSPQKCPQCQFFGIHYSGLGTQRLEAEVRTKFSDFPCLRMDTDTMQRPGSHERALARFRSGEVRILLGTQMIAKGLDFPEVTLVGVVNADTGLHLPDFRAAERTFQLVTQVAGRAGRSDRGGRVLVQTFTPEHPAIQAAIRHDYQRFADYEMPLRESLGYPPFRAMIRLVIRGEREAIASEFAKQLAEQLRQTLAAHAPDSRILGPAPAPLAKLRGLYRFHLLIMDQDADALRAAVRAATADLSPPAGVQWIADVDPLEML